MAGWLGALVAGGVDGPVWVAVKRWPGGTGGDPLFLQHSHASLFTPLLWMGSLAVGSWCSPAPMRTASSSSSRRASCGATPGSFQWVGVMCGVARQHTHALSVWCSLALSPRLAHTSYACVVASLGQAAGALVVQSALDDVWTM